MVDFEGMKKIIWVYCFCNALALVGRAQAFGQSRLVTPGRSDQQRSLEAGVGFRYAAARTTPCVVQVNATVQQSPAPPELPITWKEASSSGVIVSSNGYIVTNYHAIRDARRINVVLADERSYIGEVVGVDSVADLALLHVRESGLSYIEFGDSDSAQAGDWVLAVGNPLDLSSTVTSGIIGARCRSLNTGIPGKSLDCYIQTDAVANPGNSGGALVDIYGRLIGITAAIESPTGLFAGYSFAIPANIVKKVVNDLFRYKKVMWAHLGIAVRNTTGFLTRDGGAHRTAGVGIDRLDRPGAAADGGLNVGDFIIRIDDDPIPSSVRFREVLAGYRPDDKIRVAFLRGGMEFGLIIPLRESGSDYTLFK